MEIPWLGRDLYYGELFIAVGVVLVPAAILIGARWIADALRRRP